ncbi:MAG: [FeFe] hydrogenase H-cluster radical SAM maturase HydE [Clostridia bacterium]|nr:[FeFe] hydrogenase H-cluster radical SAM maturase HydE [Clostridia bacterium]NLS85539.1 [FeFe] hydrogenase H-cluster radical SAM maturase HydE [Oscillospiraceae bacterium]
MNEHIKNLIEKLASDHALSLEEYAALIDGQDKAAAALLAERAVAVRKELYGNAVYVRGLIEVSNICKNDCNYCGIRRGNKDCERYRLTKEQILDCCAQGYEFGFRTFVMQGGEDAVFDDDFVCDVVRTIKQRYPSCAITLSLGERSRESYLALYKAGADRYLLRHETADKEHYEKLHPKEMSFERRMQCLADLKEIGFQTGCGFMVGSPFQTTQTLAKDLKFIENFKPAMCGVGPFIPHEKTPFRDEPAGTLEQTVYLLSIIKLICPTVLLPSTTALGTIHSTGREIGILAGANVIMPNLSPISLRKKYELYNNKLCSGAEAAEQKQQLSRLMQAIGYEIVTARGDVITYNTASDKKDNV